MEESRSRSRLPATIFQIVVESVVSVGETDMVYRPRCIRKSARVLVNARWYSENGLEYTTVVLTRFSLTDCLHKPGSASLGSLELAEQLR